MIGRGWRILGFVAILSGPVWAEAPVQSPVPVKRPMVEIATILPGQGAAISLGDPAEVAAGGGVATAQGPLTQSPLPRARPVVAGDLAAGAATAAAAAAPALALASTSAAAIAPVAEGAASSPVPKQRKGLFGFLTAAAATRTQPDPGPIVGRAGSVCGVAAIRGKALPPIAARARGCGLAKPVEVTAVDGVALTPAATMDCPTAKALNGWVQSAAKPAFAGKGGGLEALRVAASYICRTRNNVPGARISEHGRGKAIDISAFILASGAEVTVAHDYRRGGYSGVLKAVHKAACGPFGTTLGPGSDGMHEDHIHLDTASYRSGNYCR